MIKNKDKKIKKNPIKDHQENVIFNNTLIEENNLYIFIK